jgi:hypothetical protein
LLEEERQHKSDERRKADGDDWPDYEEGDVRVDVIRTVAAQMDVPSIELNADSKELSTGP